MEVWDILCYTTVLVSMLLQHILIWWIQQFSGLLLKMKIWQYEHVTILCPKQKARTCNVMYASLILGTTRVSISIAVYHYISLLKATFECRIPRLLTYCLNATISCAIFLLHWQLMQTLKTTVIWLGSSTIEHSCTKWGRAHGIEGFKSVYGSIIYIFMW